MLKYIYIYSCIKTFLCIKGIFPETARGSQWIKIKTLGREGDEEVILDFEHKSHKFKFVMVGSNGGSV